MDSPLASLLLLVSLATAIRVPVSYDDTPTSCPGPAPSKVVLCYYEGIIALKKLDPCLCTHLIFTEAATVNPSNYTLNLTSDVAKATRELRLRNPELLTLVRVGGHRVSTDVAEALVKSGERRATFASSVSRIIRETDINGIELSFTLETKGGSKHSKGGIVALAKLLRKEMGAEKSRRSKRDYSVFEVVDDISTTAWTPVRRLGSRDVRRAELGPRVPHRPILRSARTDTDSYEREMLRQSYLALEQRTPTSRLLMVNVPTQPEVLVKRYDLKTLSKYADFFTVPTNNLTDLSESGVTYHPSRLMGLADLLNTDSLLDLLTGLGAPRDKLVISIPAVATHFTLQDAERNTPRSPVLAAPDTLTQTELCGLMSAGGWTVERDEDLTAPYAFKNDSWIAFDDSISVGIKSKYVILRDLAGAALYPVDAADWTGACAEENGTESGGPPRLLRRLHHAFTTLARRSRGAVLETLQEDIRTSTLITFQGDIQLSPYRIVRVVDNLGAVHVVRKDARTEFECSRQGYFRHPLGCNRFYRCVKFNQYSADFTVFEYDCPDGLAFDERWEVCVWPGSLPEGACEGSSEIAPVPKARYACPAVEGYYADPENCRWFFACLDHSRDGVTPLTAYEFRCPFGLVFDEQNLLCQWPWLVNGCGNIGVYAGAYFGAVEFGSGARRGYVATAQQGYVTGAGATSVAHGSGFAAGHTSVLTNENIVTASGAARGQIKYETTVEGSGGFFGGQVANSYIAGSSSSERFGNSGFHNEGRGVSSYASLPDSLVSGGRIENSGGVILGETVGIHGVGAGDASVTSDGLAVGVVTDGGNAAFHANNAGARTLYSSGIAHGNEGGYFSGGVVSSVPVHTVQIASKVPAVSVGTLKTQTVSKVSAVPVAQAVPVGTVINTPQFSVAQHVDVHVATSQVPVQPAVVPAAQAVPVTTFRRPSVVKVPVQPAAVSFAQPVPVTTVVKTSQIPSVQPAAVPVAPAVPVTTYQQTVVETPQVPVVPVTTFRRPGIGKAPVVQSAAVPVAPAVPFATYQQTVVETPQVPVAQLNTVRRPAVAKIPVQSAAVPVAPAVPITTYQQTVIETPQVPVAQFNTFRRPAVAKISVQSAAVPVAPAVPITTYQQAIIETPQVPVAQFNTVRRPALAKVPVIQSAAVPVAPAVPVTTYQSAVVETPQVPVSPVTTFKRPNVANVPVIQPVAVPVAPAAPVRTYQQTVVETPQIPVVQPTALPVAPSVPITTYQQTVVETPQVRVAPVTTFRRPAVAKVPVVQSAAVVAPAVPVTTYEQTVADIPKIPVAPIATFRRPALAKFPVEIASVPVAPAVTLTPQNPVAVKTFRRPSPARIAVAQPTIATVTPAPPAIQQSILIGESSPSQVPLVETAPRATYVEGTPVPPVVSVRTRLRPAPAVVETYQTLTTPAPAVAGVQLTYDANPAVSVVTGGAAGISTPLSRSKAPTFGDVIQSRVTSGGYSYSTPATPFVTGVSVPVSPAVNKISSFGGFVSTTPAPAVFTGSTLSVAPVGGYAFSTPAPILATGSPVPEVPILKSRLSYSTPATTIFTGSAVPVIKSRVSSFSTPAVPLVPAVKSNIASVGYSRPSTAPAVTAVPFIETKPVGYSYQKPSVPFVTGNAATFRGASLASGLEPAIYDNTQNLAAGLEIPSSTIAPTIIGSGVTRKAGATRLRVVPTSSNLQVEYPLPTFAPAVAVTSVPLSRGYAGKVIVSTPEVPIVRIDGNFGARTSFQGEALLRDQLVPQVNFSSGTYAPPPAGFSFDSGRIRGRGRGRPYSGFVSTTPVPEILVSTPNPLLSVTQKVTGISTAVPVVTNAYVSPVVPSVTPALAGGYRSRIGGSTSERIPATRTRVNYDRENVEALLDKYSGNFGGILNNNKEGFISGVIADDISERGRVRISQSSRGRGNVGFSTTTEAPGTVFSTGAGYSSTPATDFKASTLEYSRGFSSTTSSTPVGGLRGKVRYDTDVNIDADGGIGYDAVTVGYEGVKSKSKEAPVVVITRLSDVNPLLLAKLGAQCTCKSNTLTLKRPDGYSRGSPKSSPIFYDDVTPRSGTYKAPQHVPAAPLPGSDIVVTGSSPDISLVLGEGISSTTPVNLAPISLSTPRTDAFLHAVGLNPVSVTPAPSILVTTPRPGGRLQYTSGQPLEINSPVLTSEGVRSRVRPVVSTPAVPLVEVSSPTAFPIGVRSRARPGVASTTSVPLIEVSSPALIPVDVRSRVRPIAASTPVVPLVEVSSSTPFPIGVRSRAQPVVSTPIVPLEIGSPIPVAGDTRSRTRPVTVSTPIEVTGVPVGLDASARAGIGAGRSFDRYGPGGWRGLDETLQGSVDCQRAGLFRHPKYCNKFYACHWDQWKGRYTLHVFNCPVHLAYDSSMGACNWPSKGPACVDDNLLV
ncbi:mucin-17-like [Periplaneta americana]|uniref:mucin-17-like n=1 Tax=Periplaneta americana TaxID=6978 RepID=UPI0037E72989